MQKMEKGDSVLIVATEQEVEELEIIFGKKEEKDWNNGKIDWNAVDGEIESRNVIVSRPELNGKRLGDLQIRKSYGINISRVTRGDVKLLATYDLRLLYGDTLTIVGKREAIDNVAKFFGNTLQSLNEPNMMAIFIGMKISQRYPEVSLDWLINGQGDMDSDKHDVELEQERMVNRSSGSYDGSPSYNESSPYGGASSYKGSYVAPSAVDGSAFANGGSKIRSEMPDLFAQNDEKTPSGSQRLISQGGMTSTTSSELR